MRLIDADALLKSAGIFEATMGARGCGKSILHLAKAWLFNEVNKAPTIDAVEVVRCKDCKHYGREQELCHGRVQRFCELHKGLVIVDKHTFCSYGERRDDNA